MTIYDELVARGLIAQVTDEKEIKELINNGKATFYSRQPSRWTFHGSLPYEETSDGRKQAYRAYRWRYSTDR